ncbi:unnamed protein product [Spodoptera exigua]|nr:unnamed protein product [Spodoptera exigua]
MTALGNFGIVGSLVRSFGLARGAGAQIFNLLQNVPTINPLLDKGFVPHTAEGTIELKNVVFQYPSRPDVPVLKGVSLSVKRGQSVALVGHSGSGKSTVIQLISRYYDVVSGSVCVDNIDVRELSVRWLRSQIGLVRQEPVLFNNTVRENIRYGRDDATDEEIEAAAEKANAHYFIIKLPKGYDTLVGERGASLSGGQKQRIAIARALVREPRLLLLDEATSALDTASEAKVQLALDKAAEGRATVVVAHRLSTIRHVSLIYVFQGGEIVESGNHDELMANKEHTILREESGISETSKEDMMVQAVSFGVAGAHLTERLRTQMFEHLLQQHISFFDERRNSTGALCAKLSAEASYVQGATGQRIGTCLQGIGSVGLALVLAMLFEYRLGLVALCFLPLIIIVIHQQIKATRRESYGNAKALESSTKIAIEAVSNVRTVVCLGRERMFVNEYVKQLEPALADAKKAAHCRGLVNGLSRSIFNFINAASLTYGGHLIVSEGVAYENILVTTQSLQMASGQMQNAFTFTPELEKGVKRGKKIALVGRSGCGKSTVIQLLQRFYDPDSGAVGYDTNIGAKGMQLSGGQKQRVAIARALIRQPQILLLDEATSALDTESEKVVQEALDAATAGRTCITIAHRLSTIRDADLICVVAKGHVAEAGTHQQLLDLKGLYYDLHANTK